MSVVLAYARPDVQVDELEDMVRSGPYYSITDGMLFMSPILLFEQGLIGPKGASLLRDDFATVLTMLELQKICVKDHSIAIFGTSGKAMRAPSRVPSVKLQYPSPRAPSSILYHDSSTALKILSELDMMESRFRLHELQDPQLFEHINQIRRSLGK